MDGPPSLSNHLRVHFEPALKPARRGNCASVEVFTCRRAQVGPHASGPGKFKASDQDIRSQISCIAFGKSVVAAC
jgi:hypothetical protein